MDLLCLIPILLFAAQILWFMLKLSLWFFGLPFKLIGALFVRNEHNVGYVYIVQQQGGQRLVKIGYSVDPDRRIRQLQTGVPYPLKRLAVFHATQRTEKELHRRFAKYHVHGEWFMPSKDIVKYARRH